MGGFLFAVWVAACAPLFAQTASGAVPAAMPAASRTTWILGSDGRLSAYGLTDLRLRMTSAPLPPAARERPENILAISRSKLPVPASRILDARDNGTAYIDAIPDSGCCGWENESSDLTYLVRDRRRATLFDEFARLHNQDYDVSFFTSNARFSPSGSEVAYTVVATSNAGQPIRLADQGKTKPEELRQIQAALAELPRVEEVAVDNLQRPRFSLANAALIGWADAHRLLVWKGGQLFLVDAASGQLTATGLKAEKAADVFLQ